MKNIYTLTFLLFMISCTPKENCIDNIKNLENQELEFTDIQIEPMLGSPYEIEYIDPYLILDNFIDDKVLLIYNTDDGTYTTTLSEGQGPNDILLPIEIQAKDRNVCIMERQTGRCRDYPLSSLLDGNVSDYKQTTIPRSDRMVKTNDAYIGCGRYDHGMLCIFNEDSEVIKEINVYPDYFDNLKSAGHKYKLGQARLCFNADHKRLILAPSFLNCINIYSYQADNLEKTDSLIIGKSRIKERILANGENVDVEDADIYHCVDVCCSKDFFYILYNGSTMAKRNEASEMYILKLTMSGVLSKIYKVNSRMKNICVSGDDSMMYAIMLNEDLDYVVAKAELK